jgi:tetratricopeptide (TPR) repeat protein
MHSARWKFAGGLLALLLVVSSTMAEAAPNRRELQARQDFAAGRYSNALELFAQLYAETLHPTYLRNIGRCQQELGEPDKAIASFRQYLAKARDLKPSEREEVEGYIRDMEALKHKRQAAASSAQTEAPASAPTRPISLAARDPEAPRQPPIVISKPEPQPETPVYGRWWFWAVIGGAVVAGTAALWASGALASKGAPCPAGVICK